MDNELNEIAIFSKTYDKYILEMEKQMFFEKMIKKTEPVIIEDEKMIKKANLTEIEKTKAKCTSLHAHFYGKLLGPEGQHQILKSSYVIYNIVSFHSVEVVPNNNLPQGIINKGIIIGYIYNNKILSYEQARQVKPLALDLLIYVLSSTNKKNINKIKRQNCRNVESISRSEFPKLISKLKIKINDYELSSKLWGLGKLKNDLVGKTIKDYEILSGSSTVLGDTYYIIVNNTTVDSEGKTNVTKLKFLMHDIQFIIPSYKGFNLPIDKTIKVGSIVKLIKPGRKNINDNLKVIEVREHPTSQRLSKFSKNRKLDIVSCVTPDNKILRFRAKDLKFINNYDKNTKKETVQPVSTNDIF